MAAERFLTPNEFGAPFGVQGRTVRDWVARGWIPEPHTRSPGGFMQFTQAQLDAVIARGRPSERAQDLEAHVLAARAKLRVRRGRSA